MGGANIRAWFSRRVERAWSALQKLLEYPLIRNGRGGCFGNGLQVIPSFICQTTLLFLSYRAQVDGDPMECESGVPPERNPL